MATPQDPWLRDLREAIERSVRGGFSDRDEIVGDMVEMFADEVEDEELLRSQARELTAQAWAAHEKAQQGWPAITDCDRLDAAFVELDASGIVCRQNFTCCGTCGDAEIGEEMENHLPPARGYAFYHMQDTSHALDGHGVYLRFGATGEGEAAALAIASEVAAMLAHHGLNVTWNGAADACLRVSMDWKRRF